MTREEAIQILKAIRVYECYPKSASEETKEAIDMAIEALQTDAVSREVYDAMVKHAKALENLSIEDRVRIMYDAVEDIYNIRIINEVVRCKDCKHGQYDATHYFCAEHGHKVYEDDFCSSGERREESEVCDTE